MPISTLKLKRKAIETNLRSQKGFTLIEILVGLFLISLIFAVVNIDYDEFTPSNSLNKAVSKLETAIRFAQDESTLRNTIVRLHIYLEKEPQQYSVEYGPSEGFVLPSVLLSDDQEDNEKREKNINKQFNLVKEFSSKNEKIPKYVKIIGVGSSLYKKLLTEFEASIYVYPTGEKDDAIIFLATEEELISLEITQFEQEITKKKYKLENLSGKELQEEQIKIAKDIFSKWLRE